MSPQATARATPAQLAGLKSIRAGRVFRCRDYFEAEWTGDAPRADVMTRIIDAHWAKVGQERPGGGPKSKWTIAPVELTEAGRAVLDAEEACP